MFKFVATKNSTEIFHRAVLQNDVSRTRLIIEEAMKDPRFNVDDINSEGLTALQFSCFAGNLEIVKILVQCGADWKIKDREGRSLLHASAMAGTLEVAKYLIRIGLKPILTDDKNCLPIDLTDDTAMIVLFLKAMLDQGYLKEMQEYMLDHPRLKRKIFQDLEVAKTQEREEINYMRELPYTSRKNAQVRKLSGEAMARKKSRGTFSELSDSISSLHLIPIMEEIRNASTSKEDSGERLFEASSTVDRFPLPQLQRSGSICSSRSSGSAHSSNAKLLGPDNAMHLPRPARSAKYHSDSEVQVPQPPFFDSDCFYAHLEGYGSDIYDEVRASHRLPAPPNSSSSNLFSATTRSSYMAESSGMRSGYFYGHPDSSIVEPIYENLPLQVRGLVEGARECTYANVRQAKDNPPPLPPRRPVFNGSMDLPALNSPDLPNETDSGIDVNEATGRVFQLSLEEPGGDRDCTTASREDDPYFDVPTVGNPPDRLPHRFFLSKPLPLPGFSNKYHSWNSRTMPETDAPLFRHDRILRRAMEYEELQKNRPLSSYSTPGNDVLDFMGTDSGLPGTSNPVGFDSHQTEPGLVSGGWIHSESGKYYPEILL